jgi:hypothetical protein
MTHCDHALEQVQRIGGVADLLIRKVIGTVAVPLALTSFSPWLLRFPVVCLMSHSSVVTMSQQHSLIKYRYLDP